MGRHGEALALRERNLVDRERVLGADHPDTLASYRAVMAGRLRSNTRWSRAVLASAIALTIAVGLVLSAWWGWLIGVFVGVALFGAAVMRFQHRAFRGFPAHVVERLQNDQFEEMAAKFRRE